MTPNQKKENNMKNQKKHQAVKLDHLMTENLHQDYQDYYDLGAKLVCNVIDRANGNIPTPNEALTAVYSFAHGVIAELYDEHCNDFDDLSELNFVEALLNALNYGYGVVNVDLHKMVKIKDGK